MSASVSGKERDKSFLDTDTNSVHFVGNVNPYIRPEGMSVAAWCDEKTAELEAKILEVGAGHVAAFIAEPILASGGVIVPPEGYHKRCLEICRQHDVLYISDEVVTAFGRLGEFFASESVFGIVPDIITSAKGITSGYVPLGAVLISDRLMAELTADDRSEVLFSNGFTYSAHPVSCAAALKNIEIMEREEIFAHVRDITPHFQARLQELRRHDIVGDTRGMGLLGCVEGAAPSDSSEAKRLAVDKEFGYRLDAKCEEKGLLLRPLINMCVFSPPLIITLDEVDMMFDIIDGALGEVNAEMC
jgi:adenosylmethionine-8-amino-7-oxononanoate aminotransferase